MQYLFDANGKKYLDCFGGIVTVSVGHCHPHVVKGLFSFIFVVNLCLFFDVIFFVYFYCALCTLSHDLILMAVKLLKSSLINSGTLQLFI